MLVVAYAVPLVMLVVLGGLVLRSHYSRNFFYFLAILLDLIAIGVITASKAPNYLFVVLFCAVLVAILVVCLLLVRDGDLLFTTYWAWLARLLAAAATIWWVCAILLTI
ncbi:hypothetical protein [Lacticaseibacillus mingshuiensis]|uniref:DUF3397 domain-containing protein n=1 Tax=Lacticaseibacillus mingshuiensis TaxID=2799574 RepID=A0ABW4CJA3_9LACO|nr:hypothetical protein [Lacticaseibacillus mingshuiensis]